MNVLSKRFDNLRRLLCKWNLWPARIIARIIMISILFRPPVQGMVVLHEMVLSAVAPHKKTRVTVIGDSHACIFHHPLLKLRFPLKTFDTCIVEGATVSGLENPHAKTQTHKIFRNKLNELNGNSTLVVMLGEVDTGFVIWYRGQKYNAPVIDMLDLAISNYEKLILEAKCSANLIVISTPLPTIPDNISWDSTAWGQVANMRREIMVSQRERTDLTLKFNRLIQKFCEDEGVTFINLDMESLGDDGLVNIKLLNRDRGNHHYNPVEFSNILSRRLKSRI